MPSAAHFTPLLLHFANCTSGNDVAQLRDARRILHSFPCTGAQGLPLDHSSRHTRPVPQDKSAYIEREVLQRHPISTAQHPYSSMSNPLRGWFKSI